MDHSDFDSVSWRNDAGSDASRPTTSHTDTEPTESSQVANGKRRMSSADDEQPAEETVDSHGLDGMLECTVDTPLKENDGTKDAFISYLVTTHVSRNTLPVDPWRLTCSRRLVDRLQILPALRILCPSTLHGFCFPVQDPVPRIPSMRRPSSPRQAQDGVCAR